MEITTLAAWAAAFFLASSLFSHDVALRLLLLALTVVLSAAALARSRERARLRLLPPIWLPFLLWGAWAGLSLLWSIDPALTRREFQNEVIYTGLALLACHIAAQARRAGPIFLCVGALASVLLCATAFVDFWHDGEVGLDGWHGGQGNLSGLLLFIAPCAAMSAWYARRTQRRAVAVASAAVIVLALLAAYTTLNRTVWIGFTVQTLLAGSVVLFSRRSTLQRGTLKIAAIAAVLTIMMGAAMATLTHEERLVSREAQPLEQDPRIALWPVAASLTLERPLLGHGFGRGMLHRPLVEATGDPMLWHSHNLFLDAVLQTGAPGLLLLLLLLGATLKTGLRLARSGSDRALACGTVLVAVVAGMVIRNMTDLVLQRHVALTYWAIVAILIAWGAKDDAARGAVSPRPST